MPRESSCAEKYAKRITLLSIEINLERTRIKHRTIARFAVVGDEIIVIVRHIPQHIKRPLLGWSPRHHQLIVEEIRAVFSFRVERA